MIGVPHKIIIGLVTFALCGCDFSTTVQAPSESPTVSPKSGSSCTVHFRRNVLGAQSDVPIPVESGNHNGADITVSGEFLKMDDDWLVLKQGDSEKWITRSAILYMSVKPR